MGEKVSPGTSLVAQWLRICLPRKRDTGSIPGPGIFHTPQIN